MRRSWMTYQPVAPLLKQLVQNLMDLPLLMIVRYWVLGAGNSKMDSGPYHVAVAYSPS